MLGLLLLATLGLAISRAGLIIWQWPRVAPTGGAGMMMLQGLRSDLMAVGWVLAPALLLLPIFVVLRRIGLWLRISCFWFAFALMFLALLELATPQFIIQYDVRPNRIFADYLMYPREVISMLLAGFRTALILGLSTLAVLAWLIARHLATYSAKARPWPARRTLLIWPLVVVAVFFMIRSNTHGRPVHLGNFSFSGDAMVNSLVANSAYTMLTAVYQMKHEAGLSQEYGEMPVEEMVRRVRSSMSAAPADFLSDELPTLHRQNASVRRAKPLNLVIILEESLGSDFVERLGGRPLTPNLERLADSGIWFNQLYATGTQTSRGIEAVIAGFVPTPARPVVRLSKAQKDFFTLGTALKQASYHNEFIYGGDSNFDNRAGFFLSNGFDAVTDRSDYKNPIFPGYLGVSDEDLFEMTHQRLQALHEAGQPFFVLALSLTNHPPYDYPDGRIKLANPSKATVENTALYSDYALGKFIERARASPYWADTLFLVVADHEARVRGDSLVPVHKFHIPGLILGADTRPLQIDSTASQIDLAPTLLSMIGIDGDFPFVGRDLTRTLPEFGNSSGPAPRAIMQFNQYFAWMQNDQVTILLPDDNDADKTGDVRHFLYDRKTGALRPSAAATAESDRQILAQALMPAWLYREQRYRVRPLP